MLNNKLKDAILWLRFLLWCKDNNENLEGREISYLDVVIDLLKKYKGGLIKC